MELIQSIEISRFRSIKSEVLRDPKHFAVLAGVNNSGKSNFLRALVAFFSDFVEPGQRLRVDVDYYRPEVRAKKKKRISVKVFFRLPQQFGFRKGLEGVEALLGRDFAIKKEWVRGEVEPRFYLNNSSEPLDQTNQAKVSQFLSLISFRYIPNRVLPLDVVKQEHQALRDVLIRRLGKIQRGESELFARIRSTSTRLIGGLSERIHGVFPGVQDVRLATPTAMAEMVFGFGYRLSEGGQEFEDVIQGSGLQSFLMFQTLHLIDRDYFQKFGWRQAAIWAIEEPESSLHTSLEAHTASFLSAIAKEQKSRLQIFATTHSDLVIQYADRGFFVEKEGVSSRVIPCEPQDMLERTARAGISRWVHPILFSPLKPLVLVEGKQDWLFLTKAFSLLGSVRPCNVSYLALIAAEEGVTGGVDSLAKYVREHKNAIKARSKDAPVVVVLDWDAERKKGRFEKFFSSQDPFRVLVWPRDQWNPRLSKSFHGVERYFSDRLITEAERKGANISRNIKGVATIEKDDYGECKRILGEIVGRDLRVGDLQWSKEFLKEILTVARR